MLFNKYFFMFVFIFIFSNNLMSDNINNLLFIGVLGKTHNPITTEEIKIKKDEIKEILFNVDSGTTWNISLSWGSSNSKLKMYLIDPKGKKIKPKSKKNITFINVEEKSGGLLLYSLNKPKKGEWKAYIQLEKPTNEVTKAQMFIMNNSTINVDIFMRNCVKQNSTFLMTCGISDGPKPIINAQVKADIFDSEENLINQIQLYDNGKYGDKKPNDGEYSFSCNNTTKTGWYHVKFYINGTLDDGSKVKRIEEYLFKVVSYQEVTLKEILDVYLVGKKPPYGLESKVLINNPHGVNFKISALLYPSDGKESITRGFGKNQMMNGIKGKKGEQEAIIKFDTDGIYHSEIDGPYIIKGISVENYKASYRFPSRSDLEYKTNTFKYSEFKFNDMDRDGISDIHERKFLTNKTLYDTDTDGLSDFDEINYDNDPTKYTAGKDTNPNHPDTDKDSYLDGQDKYPLNPNKH